MKVSQASFVLSASSALFLALVCSAAAQSCKASTGCAVSSFDGSCQPTLPPGVFDCSPNGPWSIICSVWTNQCAPAAAPSETNTGKCKACTAGQPISLADGNTYIEQNDLRVPGLGGGLSLERIWNSKWPASQSAYQIGLFGPNWRSTFEERIFAGNDGYVKYARADGSFWSFGVGGAGWLPAAPINAGAVLTASDTQWTMVFKNGEQRIFDKTSGWLVAIVDRNGNTTQLSYDGLNRLTTVTDPALRHLNFTYAGGSSYLVTSVSSDVGLSLTYTYDAQGRLLQVTKPDQSTLNFEYDPNSYITAVKDLNGKVLESHTYDRSGRGLSSSRADGVENVTVSYPQ